MLESLKETKKRRACRFAKIRIFHTLCQEMEEKYAAGGRSPFLALERGTGEGRPHLFAKLYISPRCYACKFSRYESLGMRGLENRRRTQEGFGKCEHYATCTFPTLPSFA